VHGASAATAQDTVVSIENFVPCEDGSEYDEEEDTGRLIRKPRVPDVQKSYGVNIDGNPWFDKTPPGLVTTDPVFYGNVCSDLSKLDGRGDFSTGLKRGK
jgi:hypothetical protein